MKLKKGDQIIVKTGKDKSKKGIIEQVFPKGKLLLAAGINIVKKHRKPRSQKEPGGIIEMPKSLRASNVLFWCERCQKGVRLGYQMQKKGKVRICRSCQAPV